MVSSISNIWFMSKPAVRICAMFVAFSRVCSSTVVVGALGPSSSSGIPYQCMRCSFIVPVLCLVVLYCGIVVLADSSSWHSPPPPSPNCRLSCRGFIFYLFVLFIHSSIYVFLHWAIGSSVTGAQRELGARGLQLDWGLGRPVRCSSTLGCDCSCNSWAPWASSFHLWCGCKLDIKLFLYLFGIFIQAGSVWLWKAGLHCLYKW